MTRRGRARGGKAKPEKLFSSPAYRNTRNTFALCEQFSADEVAALHEAALTLLEEQGIRVLLPEARDLYASFGAKVTDDEMVFIGRDIIEQTIETAPGNFTFEARNPARSLRIDRQTIHFGPGAGCPNVTDLERGRRPGTMRDFEETIKLQHAFDVCALLGPSAEAQDIPVHLRHLHTSAAYCTLSDKIPFYYSRGTAQAQDCFAITRLAHGIDEAQFDEKICCFTVINTNSPRQIDKPMAQGLIDFACANQVSVVTPFCLAGAMAPVTIAGALTLSHAEALAGIALAQIARPGAPMVYGVFSSNVDLKSGAPVFGTPEHMRANFGGGQLARHIGLPWRSASGTAANSADAQGAAQTAMGLWGTVHAGANLVFHAAGWLEGGLTFGYEKYITDLDMLHTICLAMQPVKADADEIGLDNIASVAPGGHFFDAPQTMERYRDAFYDALLWDSANVGQWEDAGRPTAEQRATAIWKNILENFEEPPIEQDRREAIADFVARREAEGGAAIMD